MAASREALLASLAHEPALTRRLLAGLPDGSMAWQPHPRAFTLGGLATHLARLPHWGAQIVSGDGYDLSKAAAHRDGLGSRGEILALFDRHAGELDAALRAATPTQLDGPWHLRRGDTVVETLTRLAAVERFTLHHLIHHRGQLTVYARMLNVPIPPLYGPTGDPPA